MVDNSMVKSKIQAANRRNLRRPNQIKNVIKLLLTALILKAMN